MKKLIIILIMAVICLPCNAITKKTVYGKDSTKTVYTIYNDLKYVKIERFYSNGVLMETGQISDAGRIGTWTSWYDNGNMNSIVNFKKDKKHGSWKFYNYEGNLSMELIYKKNKLIRGVKWESDRLVLVDYITKR